MGKRKLQSIFNGMASIKSSVLLFYCHVAAAQVNYARYVNPFIGGEGPIPGQAFGGGDIFVGGAVPFGVAKVGLDTYEENRTIATTNGGWTPQGLVTGLSMMHESGTGGCPKYGIISQMPLTIVDAPVNVLDNTTYWQRRVVNDSAKVGYFSTEFENGVTVELAGARHSGILEYTFPADAKNQHVLVDVSHYLPDENGGDCTQYYVDGEINVSDNGSSYTGYGTYAGGWNMGAAYTVYFCGEFETAPTQAEAFNGQNFTIPNMGGKSRKAASSADRIGALFTWIGERSVRSQVGISFISVDKACTFRQAEITSWDLNDTMNAAVAEWNKDVFSKIRVDTSEAANETDLILLYSSLYFMHLMPSERTGENPLWQSDEPYWDDFYTFWDTFRNTDALYHLIQIEAYESQIRSLIDIWRHDGFMPDGRSGNYNGLTQGGSNADNVLADAYVKGLLGAINWTDGYAAMVKDAEVPPTTSNKEGRGALNDWLQYGYVTQDRNERCLSRTVEYSLNDFSVSQVARGVRPDDVQKYLNRSAGWQLTWDHATPSVNTTPIFTGFLTPRLSDGSFNSSDYNPAQCGGCEWSSITYEATPFEYSFTIPHDMSSLIAFMGGESNFEARLDYIFLPNTSQANLGANGASIDTIMNIGNEPDFQTPYLYNYINKQWKSVNQTRSLARKYFRNAPYGVPGNSDAGALNSWLIWQMLGLYPVVTQPVYLIGSPWFSDLNMTVSGNQTLRITATGLGEGSYFVQSVKINGKQWERNWFEHTDIMVHGGTIEFVLGSTPLQWEEGDVPPSPGHVNLATS